jgi:hypothetical protein
LFAEGRFEAHQLSGVLGTMRSVRIDRRVCKCQRHFLAHGIVHSSSKCVIQHKERSG